MKNCIGFLSFIFLLLSFGCSDFNEEGQLITIKLEKSELTLSDSTQSVVVKASESSWGISHVRIFEKEDEEGEIYHNTLEVKDSSNGGSYKSYKESMSYDFFTVTKSAPTELTVELQENNTGKERKMTIVVEGGVGYMGADLYVTQKAKE